MQETIMVEFGGEGETTSNLESMPIPSIAGMTHYHYDLDHNLIAESLSNGKVQREYIYLPANLAAIADSIDMTAASALPLGHLNNTNNGNSTNELLYILNDHLRTPTKLTNSAKAVLWDRFQTPFGENASLTGTKETNLRLPGQYFDFESNYHYNLMRDYDAKTGRYLQSDPIGLAGGINRFGYVDGSPINFVDPTGENPILASALLGAGIGAILRASINNYHGNGPTCMTLGEVFTDGLLGAIPGGVLLKYLSPNYLRILGTGAQAIGKVGSNPAIREIAGGAADAQKLFNQLSRGGTIIKDSTYKGTLVKLPDGGIVGIRNYATRSPGTNATIDVKVPGIDIRKIKFN
ncbi:MAG: RHS repeat-associated core domain-containing protein [Alphaproteobacteria bacterium]|nr:MAG: RHS repeat-associated core domain-containing protein [Alphaproteobacteria bacterium]